MQSIKQIFCFVPGSQMTPFDQTQVTESREGGGPFNDQKGENAWDWNYQNLAGLLDLIDASLQRSLTPPHGHLLNQKQLINVLNRFHFLSKEVALVFRQERDASVVIVPGKPGPCTGDGLLCTWGRPEERIHQRKEFRFVCLLIDEGRRMIVIQPAWFDPGEEGIKIKLPGKGLELAFRQNTRYRCPPHPIQIMQDGLSCEGTLVEFSGATFAVEIKEPNDPTWRWFNPQVPVTVFLKNGSEVIYSGEGRMVKEKNDSRAKTAIIRPLRNQIQRIRRQEIRSERVKLFPPPNIHFRHPVIDKFIKLPMRDLSYSGFSVEEKQGSLMPGLIIPEVRIEFPDASQITCRAQVIYQVPLEDDIRKSGFFILQISSEDHRKLSNLINKGLDHHIEVNGDVDFDSLWKMFFDSGFIYPEKYHYLLKNREHLPEIYRRVYIRDASIAHHFTYQDRGEILGHVAMLRIFENTWMVHHFTAIPEQRYKRVGLVLLYQLNRYINDCFNLASSNLRYVLCFFQPSNKFSNLVFGGAVRKIGNPAIVSLDSLAYMNFPSYIKMEPLALPWTLEPVTQEDREELEFYYRSESGGLLLEALDMSSALPPGDTLGAKYRKAGLQRERTLLAVKLNGRLKAVISVLITDAGLNLSELTNSALLIILDQEAFPFEMFLKVLGCLGMHFPMAQMPVMIYPREYAEKQGVRYERVYNAWVINLLYREYYAKYLQEVYSKIKLI